jgi:hypothetical protein
MTFTPDVTRTRAAAARRQRTKRARRIAELHGRDSGRIQLGQGPEGAACGRLVDGRGGLGRPQDQGCDRNAGRGFGCQLDQRHIVTITTLLACGRSC